MKALCILIPLSLLAGASPALPVVGGNSDIDAAEAVRPSGAIPIDTALLQGLGDSRYHLLDSETLERSFHIFVRLPEGYEESVRRYPTIYLLDGGITFPMLSSYYRYLVLGEEIPEAIVVGISYGTEDWQQGNFRSTDFTAPSEEREYWGGASQFQRMLASELLPLIQSTYRSDSRRRVLFGQSLGGQFVLFAAQTQPSLFLGYIASNPALHRNLDYFLETDPGARGTDRSRLFVSSGSDDEERFRGPALRWMKHWTAQNPHRWKLETTTLRGYGHFSAAPEAFRRGLAWIFEESE